jgi:hypothetical protein
MNPAEVHGVLPIPFNPVLMRRFEVSNRVNLVRNWQKQEGCNIPSPISDIM